jgi:hypothetical protein
MENDQSNETRWTNQHLYFGNDGDWKTRDERFAELMEEFTADVNNIRYKETDQNWEAMSDFLYEHDLDPTAHNLRLAYRTLKREKKLDLLPVGRVAEPEPTPTPTAQPATPVVPITARAFRMYRNGLPITGNVRSV